MTIIPFPYYPYIKKEDARDLVKSQRMMMPAVLCMGIIVIGIMQFFVTPKLLNLYKELNEQVPLITQLSPYILGLIVSVFTIISIYFLATPPNYERLEKVLSKYKDGEMIKRSEIVEVKYEALVLILLGLMVAYLVISTIVPIYNLTAKLQ